MHHHKLQLKASAVTVAVICTLCCAPAFAIRDGVAVDANTVIANPFNPAKPIEAWKLVGHGDCSGIRISKEWVMAAGHCGFGVTATFSSEQGTAPVDTSTCTDSAAVFGYSGVTRVNDINICRLANQGTLKEPDSYPVLAVMPKFDPSNATKFGGLLLRGMAKQSDTAPLQVALVDPNGMPLGFDVATLDMSKNVPYVVNGDSGGGAYWLPPSGQDAALVGVISSLKGTPGGIALVPWYFTADNLTKLYNYIVARGQPTDQKPVIKTTPDAYYSAPAAAPAPSMSSPPSLASTNGLASAITVTWTPPSSNVAIDAFRVSLGQVGLLKQAQSVSAGLGNRAQFVGVETSANNVICVTPTNTSGGPATAAYSASGEPVRIGCTSFDNRAPGTPAPTAPTSKLISTSGIYAISTTWPQPTSTNVAIRAYRVSTTTSFASGPKRTSTQNVSTTSASVTTTTGSTVCMSVAAISQLGVIGPFSAAQCKTAQ